MFFAGQALHGGGGSDPGQHRLQAGPLSVSYDRSWWRGTPPSGLAQWSGLTNVDGSQAEIGVLEDPTPLRLVFGGPLPAPQRVRIGTAPALAYRSARASAYVFTTAGGRRLALACSDGSARRACASLAGTVAVQGAIDGDQRGPVVAGLGSALAAVPAAWRAADPQLRSRLPTVRLAGARRLAAAYAQLSERAAAVGLTTIATAARVVADRLPGLGATTNAARRRAARGLERAQRDLRAAIGALRGQGYSITEVS